MNNYWVIIISQSKPKKHTNSTSYVIVELKIMDLFRKGTFLDQKKCLSFRLLHFCGCHFVLGAHKAMPFLHIIM